MVFSNVSIEKVREFWNKRPCNIKHSKKPIGTKEYFDEVEEKKYFVEPHIRHFAKFESCKNKRVLEIGCGIGTDTMNFARNAKEVYACDLSDVSLDVARQRARIYNLENKIHFFHANAEKLSEYLKPQIFDIVYSFGVIHHSPNPKAILKEIKKYCNKNSIVKIMVYNKYSYKVLWILINYGLKTKWNSLNDLIARYSESQEGSPVTYTYTRREIVNLLKSCGYIVKRVEVDHIFIWQIPYYNKNIYKRTLLFAFIPNFVLRFLEKLFGWHMLITCKI